jgi:predicted ATPase
MIKSLQISRFRCFRDLQIENLQQFNLVVGESGSGKTAFLESIFLLGAASPEVWMRLRQWRGHGNIIKLSGTRASYESIFRDIFYDFRKHRGAFIELTTESGLNVH